MRDSSLGLAAVIVLASALGGCGGGAGGSTATPLRWVDNQKVPAYSDANGGASNSIYPYKIEVWGGAPLAGYSWRLATGSALPVPGLLIDAATGVIHGTLPNGFAEGLYPFKVNVSDGSSSQDISMELDVNSCDSTPGGVNGGTVCAPVIGLFRAFGTTGSSGSLNDQMALYPIPTSKAIGFQISVVGGKPPYAFRVVDGTLPPGLVLNASTGVLHGSADTGSAGRTFNFSVGATDAAGTAMVKGNAPSIPFAMTF